MPSWERDTGIGQGFLIGPCFWNTKGSPNELAGFSPIAGFPWGFQPEHYFCSIYIPARLTGHALPGRLSQAQLSNMSSELKEIFHEG
jgi:hypothetical protein